MSSAAPSSTRARSSAASVSLGGGQAPVITLETRSPLPRFRVPHFIPQASTSISSFKLSILRILTGQISTSSATAAATRATQPMTHAELVKTQALEGWRAKMILLELRQNSLIAPETRERRERRERGEEDDDDEALEDEEDELTGFVLEDEHECALLEEGDEVIIRIKSPHTIQDLQLPSLSASHNYGLPAGSLTRAGTLSAPPPYSLINPSEPSSHSSSIQAQPNANFHAHTYRDYSRGWREIRIDSSQTRDGLLATGAAMPSGLNHGTTQALASANTSRPSASRTRRASSGQVMTTITAGVAGVATAPVGRRRPSRNASALVPSSANPQAPNSGPSSPRLPHTPTNGGAAAAAAPSSETRSPSHASVEAAPPMISRPSNGAHSRRHSSSAAQHQGRTSGPKNLNLGSTSGQASMPSTALIIGPGVQGAVGRSASGSGAGASSPGQQSPTQTSSAAFAAFTAAGGEIRPVGKTTKTARKSSMGTASPLNGSGGKASMGNVATAINGSGAAKPTTRRRASSHDLLSTAAANNVEEPPAIVAARERVRRELEEEREKRAKRAAEAAEARRLAAELAEIRRVQMASADGGVSAVPPAVQEGSTGAAPGDGAENSSTNPQPTSGGIKAGLAALLKPNVGLPPPPTRTKSTSSSSSFKLGGRKEREKDKDESKRSASGATSPPTAAGAAMALNAAVGRDATATTAATLPPIHNLAPFPPPLPHTPIERGLPPMPGASQYLATTSNATASASVPLTSSPGRDAAADEQFAQDMALALALSESEAQMVGTPLRDGEAIGGASGSGGGNGLLNPSSALRGSKPQAVARANSYGFSAAFDAAATSASASGAGPSSSPGSLLPTTPGNVEGPSTTPGSNTSTSPPISRAEKRFQSVQRLLAKEISKQTEAERSRALESHNREVRRKEEARVREEEERERKVKEQWEVWEEVRRREKKAGLPPPRVVQEDERRVE